MTEVQERKPYTVYNLVGAIEEYVNQHRHDRDTDERWFSSYLTDRVLPRARRIRSGGLNEDERRASTAFRLSEIEREKSEKQREIDRLDTEAKKLSAA